MTKITGKGLPTRKTVGAIGDIYIDSNTGKKYECIFAYREDSTGEFDSQWKEKIDIKAISNRTANVMNKPENKILEEKVEVNNGDSKKNDQNTENSISNNETTEETNYKEAQKNTRTKRETKSRVNYSAAYNNKNN